MFNICFRVFLQGTVREELTYERILPFAPTPGMIFHFGEVDKQDIRLGSRSGAELTYSLQEDKFELTESWGSHWKLWFLKLGFTEVKKV